MSTYGTVNPELLGLARKNVSRMADIEKQAFVPGGGAPQPGGDPSMGGGGGGAPPGMDPSMGGGGGGAPPPAMDPSMGGGAPPPGGGDPTAGVQGGTTDLSSLIQNQVQAAMAGMQGGGGGMGGAGMIKPKIDENVVLLQILKMLAKISDALGVHIPAQEMVVTPEDLQAMAQGGPGAAAVADQGAAAKSSIQPIQPLQGAMPQKAGSDRRESAIKQGTAFDTSGLNRAMNTASAIARIRSNQAA